MQFRFSVVVASAFLSIISVLFSQDAYAQAGAIDPSFNPTDLGFGYGDGPDGTVTDVAVQTDGKIIIVGAFKTYHGVARSRIARLNADGSLDASFNVGTGANDNISTVALQADGKIVIGGSFTMYGSTARSRIARLNTNGSLDGSFSIGTGANDVVTTIAIQSDQKIMIGGEFTTFDGSARSKITRLNANGSLDGSFTPGTGANGRVADIAVQNDGKIVIVGGFTSYNGTGRNRVARLNANGSLDGGFTIGTGPNDAVNTVALKSDSRILLGGFFTSYNGVSVRHLICLNANGSWDPGFPTGGGPDEYVTKIAIESDGQILIAGAFQSYDSNPRNGLARLTADGGPFPSPSLSVGTSVGAGQIYAIAVHTTGKIIIGGSFEVYNGAGRNNLAFLNTDGALDVLFGAGTGANGIVHAIAMQADGKILIGGDFTMYNGKATDHIARLNADGSIDPSFTASVDSAVHTIAIQDDGKIIIGGDFDRCNDTDRNRVARLNASGSLDVTFNPGNDPDYWYNHVYKIVIQRDGKIIIGGDIYKASAGYTIVRLNSNGSVDIGFGFGSGTYFSGAIRTASIQNDNKIIVGGNFTISDGGKNYQSIARLNTDGTLDAAFHPGTGIMVYGEINSASIQKNGKIIIGGYFDTSGASKTYKNIARLNTDGSFDAAFDTGSGTDAAVWVSVVQSDDKVIIGGFFMSYNGVARNRIARLNANGTVDNDFAVGTGVNNDVYAMAMQDDGKIMLGGAFTAYKETGRNRLARVIAIPCIAATTPTLAASSVVNCGVKNTTLSIATGTLNGATEWKWYNDSCGGTALGSGTSITVSPAATTTYYARGEGVCVTPGNCASLAVTVNALPDKGVALTGTTLKANQDGATYQWLDCNQNNLPVAGAAAQSYVPDKSGDYAVTVTRNGCSVTSDCVDVTITSTEEMELHNDQLTVYPNPSNGSFTIQSLQGGSYSIRNTLGQTISSFRLEGANGYTWNSEKLSPGIYFLVASHQREKDVRKIVVSK
ncbi:T9SS type A sorting domain-containing protein [Fulvivirgaceae bacterium PWU4]|uniref:T9SS type A sorting domain-containing protein n=1 Tax=Chryseosolibacter histidini TaxID=2782349 RepID=A0AAP2GI85_9BACT|nr:T9SS type A sorting domain-containing protein [Chryseosolibacter histidini]MBT1696876.1 T9SS type A sorting domain-containing protein [Chryseosolibacter histidini]